MENITYFLIAGFFGLIMLIILFSLRRTQRAIDLPNILVSIGVLGTFTGIVVGLLSFDVNNIQESVPPLLQGLKTAFTTSIMGMLLSIIVKLYPKFFIKPTDQTQEGADIDTLATLLTKLNTNATKQNELLAAVKDSIAGDGESTMLGQMKILRSEFSENLKELNASFKDFQKEMAEQNNKAFIEALQEAIKDLNKKLTEDLGDNFKLFNVGIGKMIEWQQNYKEQLDAVLEQQKTIVEGIEKVRESVAELVNDGKSLSTISQNLEQILKATNLNVQAFNNLADDAGKAFPLINENIENLTTSFSDTLENQHVFHNELLENFKKNSEEISSLIKVTIANTDENIQKLSEANKKSIEESTRLVGETVKETSENLNRQLNSASNRIEEQIKNLDAELEKALTESLKNLGNNLAAISNKFVEDYTVIAETTQKLIEIIRKNNL